MREASLSTLLVFCDFTFLCVQLSKNITKYFLNTAFLSVLILQSTCFIYITWKVNKLWEQQPHRVCEWMKSNKNKKTKVTSHSNGLRVLFSDLAHKECNGIIKGWFYCLMSESKRRFLANNILLPWCLVMAQIQFSLIKKINIGRPEQSLIPTPYVR